MHSQQTPFLLQGYVQLQDALFESMVQVLMAFSVGVKGQTVLR